MKTELLLTHYLTKTEINRFFQPIVSDMFNKGVISEQTRYVTNKPAPIQIKMDFDKEQTDLIPSDELKLIYQELIIYTVELGRLFAVEFQNHINVNELDKTAIEQSIKPFYEQFKQQNPEMFVFFDRYDINPGENNV